MPRLKDATEADVAWLLNMEEVAREMYAALQVIRADPFLRLWLNGIDPKAVEQADEAVARYATLTGETR